MKCKKYFTWKVMRLGFTSICMKLEREPCTPSMVVKKEMMGLERLGMVWSKPTMVTIVKVWFLFTADMDTTTAATT